eukprot:5022460-Ditylum_brightwellii.AAC.1
MHQFPDELDGQLDGRMQSIKIDNWMGGCRATITSPQMTLINDWIEGCRATITSVHMTLTDYWMEGFRESSTSSQKSLLWEDVELLALPPR